MEGPGAVNVPTYVHDGRGRSGIWLLSLDAARLPAVLAARAAYWLPYFCLTSACDRSGFSHTCQR